MNIGFLMKPEAVAVLGLADKHAILTELSNLFAEAWQLDAPQVLEYLEERENLGSTGFGRGFALPHARFPNIKRPIVAAMRLNRPVDFSAADGMPVDLVFGLLSPEDSGAVHLHALAAISRMLRDEQMHESLAHAPDAEALYSLLANAMDRDVA